MSQAFLRHKNSTLSVAKHIGHSSSLPRTLFILLYYRHRHWKFCSSFSKSDVFVAIFCDVKTRRWAKRSIAVVRRRRNGGRAPQSAKLLNGVFFLLAFSFLIFASARPVDDEAEVKIGKNKEYRKRATRPRPRPRRLCFWPILRRQKKKRARDFMLLPLSAFRVFFLRKWAN